MRRREGSPWQGVWPVFTKETADHLTGMRMTILEILAFLSAGGAVYAAVTSLRGTVSQDPFLFLRLFTTSADPLPAFVAFLGFLTPLVAIALGFDAINGEYNRHTLSRILSQPLYRDALLLGKYLAGLATLAVVLTATWLLVAGFGLMMLGVPPGGEEVGRGLVFLVATIAYGGVWLGMAMTFSVVFRQPATAALASIAVWLFFTIFWGIIASVIASTVRPIEFGFLQEVVAQTELQIALSRVAPNNLYTEIVVAMLQPSVRSLGPVLPSQLQGAVLGNPLPFRESLALIWPHLTGMIAAVIIFFAISYVLFQRREIRA
ncbi:MAG: ABC transporter permease [Anaerolineales bacterium]|nr:ABC transporter permease [Anaerolineales bacterium]